MRLDDYQVKAYKTSKDTTWGSSGDMLTYPIVGLANEVGELLGKLKKVYRDNNGHFPRERKEDMAKELGDSLWYISEIATQLGYHLSYIAELNLEKLEDRQRRGVIGGSGDDR